jgi:hypothetical protein
MTTYQKEGKNAHDDAEDAITGLVEQVTEVEKPKTKVRKRILR